MARSDDMVDQLLITLKITKGSSSFKSNLQRVIGYGFIGTILAVQELKRGVVASVAEATAPEKAGVATANSEVFGYNG